MKTVTKAVGSPRKRTLLQGDDGM